MPSLRHPPSPIATLGLLVALSLSALPGHADEALRLLDEKRSETTETENQQRLRQLQRQPDPAAQPQDDAAGDDTACWIIDGLGLTGNTLLSDELLAETAQPLVSSCMSQRDTNSLLSALTGLYVKAGYITARPYLAQMPTDGGTLEIQMIEGFIESIEITDPTLPVALAGAFPGMVGQPLYLPALEQGLDQLNRLRSIDLTVDIVAGSRPGATRLLLKPRQGGPRWRIASRLSNSGSDTSGRHNGLLSLSLDNPLHINDLLALTYVHTLDGGPGFSQQASAFYQVPYGPWTLDASATQIKTRSIIGPMRYVANQDLQLYGLKADRSLWRNQTTLLNASVRLDQKRSTSAFASNVLRVSSANLTVAEAGVSFTRLGRSQWNGYLGYAQGLSWLNADGRTVPRVKVQPRGRVQPRFEKYLASLSQTTWFNLPHLPLQWRTDLNVQRSPDPLPDLEQLRLAGSSSVRGYRLDGQSMSSGAVLRNTWQTPQRLNSYFTLTPVLGLDVGWGRHSFGERQTQRAVGASVGTSLGWGGGQLNLEYQQGLQRRANTGTEPGLWSVELAHNF